MAGVWSNPIKPERLYDRFDNSPTKIITKDDRLNEIICQLKYTFSYKLHGL